MDRNRGARAEDGERLGGPARIEVALHEFTGGTLDDDSMVHVRARLGTQPPLGAAGESLDYNWRIVSSRR